MNGLWRYCKRHPNKEGIMLVMTILWILGVLLNIIHFQMYLWWILKNNYLKTSLLSEWNFRIGWFIVHESDITQAPSPTLYQSVRHYYTLLPDTKPTHRPPTAYVRHVFVGKYPCVYRTHDLRFEYVWKIYSFPILC